MENTNEKNNQNNTKEKNISEKRTLIYLFILFLILVYLSLFFIHNIISIHSVKSSPFRIEQTQGDGTDDGNNNNTDNNGSEGNNQNEDGNGSQDGNESKNANGNQNGSGNKGTNGNGTEGQIIDINDRLRILEGTTDWKALKELNIFTNVYFNNQAIIAPGVEGTYNFTVENLGDIDMIYSLDFLETNPHNINMVYKLKYNGNYVSGNESTWVNYKQLDQDAREIKVKTNDIYTIEWKWEDAENDTQIGVTDGANYKLTIDATAEAITKR